MHETLKIIFFKIFKVRSMVKPQSRARCLRTQASNKWHLIASPSRTINGYFIQDPVYFVPLEIPLQLFAELSLISTAPGGTLAAGHSVAPHRCSLRVRTWLEHNSSRLNPLGLSRMVGSIAICSSAFCVPSAYLSMFQCVQRHDLQWIREWRGSISLGGP